MVKEFSEMQFAFGLTHELVNSKHMLSRGWLAPFFPTQREEGKEGGYDLSIEGPVRTIYFQFKVPDIRTTKEAMYWDDYKKPYYTFKIRPDNVSHQHNNLIELANEDPHNKVYYCAPRFCRSTEFDEHYKRGNIYRKSIYVPCVGLEQIEGSDKHEIIYTEDPRDIYIMHSEKRILEAFDGEEFLKDAVKAAPYDNIYHCLNSVQKKFNLYKNSWFNESIEGQIEKYYNLSSKLQLAKDLTLLLLFG